MSKLSNTKAVNKVILFGYNYTHNFIAHVWADDSNLAKHFQSKFSMYYEIHGSNGVFNAFYCNLSGVNQDRLVEWILTNYKG